jgi:hypothetical protein
VCGFIVIFYVILCYIWFVYLVGIFLYVLGMGKLVFLVGYKVNRVLLW